MADLRTRTPAQKCCGNDGLITLDYVSYKGSKGMEQQTQAMRSMFAMLRARARASITTGREGTRFVSLQHQKQTGNSKLGLSSCRESHRQKEARRKAVCILRKAVLAPVFWGPLCSKGPGLCVAKALLLQEPPFRVPPG